MNKSLIASAAIAAMALFPSLAEAVELKISHVRPQGAQIDIDINKYAGDVANATGGDVTLKVFAASALGNYTTVQEKISLGAIDMAIQPGAAGTDRRMQISYFPYLAKDYGHAKILYGEGGAVRTAIEDIFKAQDITVLAAYPVYFGGISLNRDAVDPGNPDAAKGIKVRVPGVKSFQMLADNLGYIGSPIPFSEAFTSVQTGVVDGVIGSGAEGYYASFRDVTKTFIRANTHFEVWYLIINTETFNELPAKDQEALKSAAKTFEDSRWEAAEQDQVANEKKLSDAGATIVVLNDEELAAAATKVRAEVWPEVVGDLGEDWAKPILDAAAK
ncbi:TRAP transporter substrate-binding protein DctP [Hoeflea sp. TYP-13]|uniref:TRAP transporter substrate-binding protein DctP n=1 Tax=Hoeflea sp. TYP-13 TaxID=3230023 RepID=UPI0034C6ABB9